MLINFQKSSKFRSIYEKAKSAYWQPESVDCTIDKNQWAAMSVDEKQPILNLLQYAIVLDSFQVSNIMELSASIDNEEPMLKAVLSFHSLMESVHSQSYSYYAETVMSTSEKEFLYKESKQLVARLNNYKALEANTNSAVANYFLEGVSFQALFRLSDILKSQSKLSGLSSILNLIKRDEDIHIETFQYILKVDEWIKPAWDLAVKNEAKTVLELTGNKELARYVNYAADLRLKALGFKINLGANPLADLANLNDKTKTNLKQNFFTGNVIYSAVDTTQNWDTDDWF
jgi:ribonucleotide reductase beta subunit family protein with ferritin-like domain